MNENKYDERQKFNLYLLIYGRLRELVLTNLCKTALFLE